MPNVIDLAAHRAKPATLGDLYDQDDDSLRERVMRALIGLDLDPVAYLSVGLGDVMDAIFDAATDLREELVETPGPIVA